MAAVELPGTRLEVEMAIILGAPGNVENLTRSMTLIQRSIFARTLQTVSNNFHDDGIPFLRVFKFRGSKEPRNFRNHTNGS